MSMQNIRTVACKKKTHRTVISDYGQFSFYCSLLPAYELVHVGCLMLFKLLGRPNTS